MGEKYEPTRMCDFATFAFFLKNFAKIFGEGNLFDVNLRRQSRKTKVA